VSGATFDDDGRPLLVLAPTVLVSEAALARPVDIEPDTRAIPPILVVDDSLTTRMLEQSILESAGYEVELAVSGEQALEKARQRRYGVFVVDVEMPGMSGFDFIAAVRDDTELKGTPAILVTSRSDPDDKRRGLEVGARAYIVKSEFDQAVLLDTVRRLVG
jgi:two-component system, chemotaxis family, sensor kinase CheA